MPEAEGAAIKANLMVALTAADRAAGRLVPLSSLPLAVGAPQCVYLRAVQEPVLVSKDILPNKEDSVGEHLLLTTDTSATYQHILTTYHQR